MSRHRSERSVAIGYLAMMVMALGLISTGIRAFMARPKPVVIDTRPCPHAPSEADAMKALQSGCARVVVYPKDGGNPYVLRWAE